MIILDYQGGPSVITGLYKKGAGGWESEQMGGQKQACLWPRRSSREAHDSLKMLLLGREGTKQSPDKRKPMCSGLGEIQ